MHAQLFDGGFRLSQPYRDQDAIFDACGFHSFDADGQLLEVHAARQEWLGERLCDLVTEDSRAAVALHLAALLETGRSRDVEVRVEAAEEGLRTLLLSADAVRDADGRFLRANGTLLDVTDARRREAELRRERDAAVAADRAKGEFLAAMSHEIRTPMTGILGMTALALATPLTGEQRDYLGSVESSARALLTVLGDILDFSRIEAGRIEIEEQAFALRPLVDAVARLFAAQAREKGLRLTVEVGADVPALIVGDPTRLRQILVNLAGNAVKFTEAGGVHIGARTAAGPCGPLLVVQVSDTGCGVPAARRRAIFQPFVQAEASTARRFGGTGLGLAISSRLAALLRGTIRLTSAERSGSTFELELPLAEPKNGARAAAAKGLEVRSARKLRILLVEDNPISQKIATILLVKRGHSVRVAGNGREALAALAAREDDGAFDLALMDVEMPEMDGLEATARIRADERTAGMKVIAMTAHAMRGDRERFLAAGMDGYVSKPFDEGSLWEEIEGAMKG